MRTFIPMGFLLILVALLVRLELDYPNDTLQNHQELNLLVFSRGQFQKTVTEGPLWERYGITHGMITLDDVFKSPRQGLGAALFDARFELVNFENFAIAKDPKATSKFVRFCKNRPTTSILVLHHFGSLQPAVGTPAHELSALFSTIKALGADLRPFQSGRASWCLVHKQTRKSSEVLAEVFSRDRNVSLAFTVTAQHMKRHTPALRLQQDFEGPAADRFPITEEFALTTHAVGNPWLQPLSPLGDVTVPALRTMPPYDQKLKRIVPHELEWRGLNLEEGASFNSLVALNPAAKGSSNGIDFVILLDGEELLRFPCPADDAAFTWREITLPLPTRESATLKLMIDLRGEGVADYAMWGDPVLTLPKKTP